MEAKLLVQADNLKNILKAQRNFKKSPKERITETYLQVRLESLEGLWATFVQVHSTLVEKWGSELRETDYMKQDFYDQAEETYLDYKTELKTALKSVRPTKKEPETGSKPSDSTLDLPKIAIPKFSGKYLEWISFRDMFTSLVHNNASLDNVQKMHYLKTSLTGEAERLLRQTPVSDANYERCWSLLVERYNNKRYLSNYILKRLFSQRNLTGESASGLKELVDTTTECLDGLQNLGIDIKNWDILVIHIISLKLDSDSRKQWELSIKDYRSQELPTFEQFKDFLTNRYRGLEFLETKSTKSFNVNPGTRSNNNSVVKFKSMTAAKVQCPFCSEAHRLSACKQFSKETVDQRRNFVQGNNVCFNCLGMGHGVKICKINIKCKLCHRRHHTLLHPEAVPTADDTATPSTSFGVPENKDDAGKTSSFVACFSTGKTSKQVLLATALVDIESKNGDGFVLRALLDQGSQESLVTESTVRALKLKKTHITGKISGVGGDKEVVSNAIVNMRIKSRVNPQIVIPVQAYVLKSITTFLPSKKVGALELMDLGKTDLADPEYNKPSKIDLLLGAEVFIQVILEGLKKSPDGSLVAQATSLGWILSGTVNEAARRSDCVSTLHSRVVKNNNGIIRDFKSDFSRCNGNESRVVAERKLKGKKKKKKKYKKDKSYKEKYKEGDVVVVKEDLPLCRCVYGRIEIIHPGRDKIKRVVTVK